MFERSVADDLSAAGGGAHEQKDQVADAARRPADLPSLRGPRRDDVGPAPADQDRLRHGSHRHRRPGGQGHGQRSDDLTQRLKYHWVIRTGWTSSQPSHPFGEYVAKTMGYRKVVVIASDYAFGWEVVGGFQKTFEESGGQVVQKLWAPLGAMDLAPYLSRIRRDADAVLTMVAGASTLQLVKQYQDAGLKSRIPLIAGGPAVDESFLPAMGDEALGIVSPLIYSAALDTPENRRFVKEYRTRFDKVPSYFSETNYTSGRWINEAVKSLGGAVEDREKLLAALRKVELS